MEKNHKILKIGISLIGIIMIFCIGFIYYCQIDAPVFLKHYYEQRIPQGEEYYENPTFTLQYITNTVEPRSIAGISFEEAPHLIFHANNFGSMWNFSGFDHGNNHPGEKYGRYTMARANISLDLQSIDKDFEEVILSKATIVFDNGEIVEEDIGKILLYSYELPREHMEVLSSTDSSDGTSTTAIRMQEDITLMEVDSPFIGHLDHLFDFTIDDVSYRNISGVQYNEQDIMRISSRIKPSEDIEDKFISYDIRPNISYKDSKGNIHQRRIYTLENKYHYRYDFWEIVSYLKAKEVI